MKKLILIVLAFVMVFAFAACTKAPAKPAEPTNAPAADLSFEFISKDLDADEVKTTVPYTDGQSVGEALVAAGLIEGEDGPYGLEVKTVNGVTREYDDGGVYWAFYEDGAYASKGVDQTPVKAGVTYSFVAEKAE